MANKIISPQDTNRQEAIKHFNTGVVSWPLFDNLWHDHDEFLKKLNFLMSNGNGGDWEINIAFDIIRMAQKNLADLWERGGAEKSETGGNDVATTKLTSV
ncbi:MAG: hypothetical protein JSV38_05865 [Desulfobacterales bacterium]|nr:MAG: hypothetical protein JSV38_05865 [Desulfobacterales bacterium]